MFQALFLTGSFLAIFVLQWWCRDLGSLPTFAAAYGCAVICRICYPKAKFSKTTLIFLCAVGVLVVIAAAKFAPGYVQDRLSVDIWNDMYGNGYQQCRALMAIAEGGLFEKVLDTATSLKSLPQIQTLYSPPSVKNGAFWLPCWSSSSLQVC